MKLVGGHAPKTFGSCGVPFFELRYTRQCRVQDTSKMQIRVFAEEYPTLNFEGPIKAQVPTQPRLRGSSDRVAGLQFNTEKLVTGRFGPCDRDVI
jgi:hypothetical protein